MENLDDILKHYGVKGMKWGVLRDRSRPGGADGKPDKRDKKRKSIKKRVGDMVRARNRKYDARMAKIADKYHEKNKNKGVYKRQYTRNVKKFEKKYKDPHRKAVLQTRKEIIETRAAIAFKLTPLATYAAVGGLVAAGKAYQKMATPDNIRRGKNIIQAMKRSPVRYADVSKYNDIIDV